MIFHNMILKKINRWNDGRWYWDTRLSWKAKGIFSYISAQKDGQIIDFFDLQFESADGKYSLKNGIRELEKLGYLAILSKIKKGKTTWIIKITI